ncbi:MAG: TCP-1/cpn60 chaperonin family protein [Pseudorhizobium sp.]
MDLTVAKSLSIQKRIVRGMAAAVGMAGATYGPAGWMVSIHRSNGRMQRTKCTATVLQTFSLQDPFEDAGAHLLAQIASQIRKHSGDGSTAGVLLSHSIATEAFDGTLTSNELAELSGVIRKDAEVVEEFLRQQVSPATDNLLRSLALAVTGRDWRLAQLVCDAFAVADDPQAVFLAPQCKGQGEVDRADGILLKGICMGGSSHGQPGYDLDKANLLFRPGVLRDWSEVEPMPDSSERPTVVLAEKILPEFRRAAATKRQKNLFIFELFGSSNSTAAEQIEAISKTFNQPLPSDARLPHRSGPPQARIILAEQKLMLCAGSIEMSVDAVLAPLQTKASIVTLPEGQETTCEERYERATQCIASIRSALQGGIVAGGGAALLDAARWLATKPAEGTIAQRGRNVLCRAMMAPMRTLVDSAGQMGDRETRKCLKAPNDGLGFDIASRSFVPALEKEIVTPLATIVTALRVASSTVGLILLTEALAEEKHVRNARLKVFDIPVALH